MEHLNLHSSSSWPARFSHGQERQFCNKLQAHKSSFQAWKTVSFGCSLLALFLIACKWREVSNDLNMLTGIESLLEHEQVATNNKSLQLININSTSNNDATTTTITQQPTMSTSDTRSNAKAFAMKQLAETLSLLSPSSQSNATSSNPTDSVDSSSDNLSQASANIGAPSIDTIIRDQIHLFLSQEFNANHLLRLEIELFSGKNKHTHTHIQ